MLILLRETFVKSYKQLMIKGMESCDLIGIK